jgi:hypothetical protein
LVTRYSFILDYLYRTSLDDHDELVQVSMLLGVICVVIVGVSRRLGDFIMGLLNIILGLAAQRSGCELPKIPQNITTALGQFNLDGRTTTYAVCPLCHCTYKPNRASNYPEICTNVPVPDAGACGTRLLEAGSDGVLKPIKTFVYHSFNDYLAALLARGDIEEMMDQSSRKARDSAKVGDKSADQNLDVLTAQYLKSFCGPSGKSSFFDGPEGEGRFAFALNVDFFHPEGTSRHSDTSSCGLISMVCLNIPLALRYKPENVFIAGIIPGPKEPHLTELNHYVKPLIDDMKASWQRGVRFSRTALSRNGRMSRSALVIAICDLLGARKLTQLTSHQSFFYCSVCECTHHSTLGRTDSANWVCRNVAEMRVYAEAWRDATSQSQQNNITEAQGLRWSELWRLPYWDPTRQLVVDPMHCLFEGLIHNHIRRVLHLTEDAKSEPTPPAFIYDFTNYNEDSNWALKEKEVKQVKQIHKLLTKSLDDEIDSDNDAMSIGETDAASTVASTANTSLNYALLRKRLLRKNLPALEFVYNNDVAITQDHGSQQISRAFLVQKLLQWVSTSTNIANTGTNLFQAYDKAIKSHKKAKHSPVPNP